MAFRRGRVVQNCMRVGGREGMGGELLLPGAGERCKIMHRVEPLSIANNYSYTPRTDRLQIDHYLDQIDDLVPHLPLCEVVHNHLYSTDPAQGGCPRSCRLYESRPVT